MQQNRNINENEQKQTWQPIEVKLVGRARDVIQGGGGKLSLTGGDPGDLRKPKGQG